MHRLFIHKPRCKEKQDPSWARHNSQLPSPGVQKKSEAGYRSGRIFSSGHSLPVSLTLPLKLPVCAPVKAPGAAELFKSVSCLFNKLGRTKNSHAHTNSDGISKLTKKRNTRKKKPLSVERGGRQWQLDRFGCS